MKTYKEIIEETCPNIKAMDIGIAEEEKAVRLYSKLMLEATNPHVKKLLKHIIEEEEHHIEEFKKMKNELQGEVIIPSVVKIPSLEH